MQTEAAATDRTQRASRHFHLLVAADLIMDRLRYGWMVPVDAVAERALVKPHVKAGVPAQRGIEAPSFHRGAVP